MLKLRSGKWPTLFFLRTGKLPTLFFEGWKIADNIILGLESYRPYSLRVGMLPTRAVLQLNIETPSLYLKLQLGPSVRLI